MFFVKVTNLAQTHGCTKDLIRNWCFLSKNYWFFKFKNQNIDREKLFRLFI